MSEPTEDDLCAVVLGLNPTAVGQIRNNFYDNPDAEVMLWLFEHRLNKLRDERRRKLEIVEPDNLKKLQGELAGLNLSSTILQRNP